MERLSMGPGRYDAVERDVPVEGVTERVELGDRSHQTGRVQPDGSGASDASNGHWLAGLVRADVLALTGVAVVLIVTVGLPFLSTMENLAFFLGPPQLSSPWIFVPPLVAGGVAMLLGLAGLRQADRQGAAGWVRALAGVAALLGLLIAAGSAVTWLYAADAELFDQVPQF